MREIELSKRLNKVTEYVIEGEPILDIGSDHAYLPLYLVKNKITPLAIAGEVVKGPYEKAKKEVIRHELTDKISVRLGSGFDVLESEELIPNIFICGMGGILISEIIEKGMEDNKISSKSRLILQANNKEKDLREFLVAFNFKIISESLIKENNKFYEIIVAEKSKSKMH
ncbi:MAG: class I SAM-dependent methyltransferase, partial [Atopostipes suicloacalis]|nr:class I SAM-dependent methyltransferase [Atopostipes suicloacalis]